MDNLERKGVLRTYAAMLEVRAKVAAHYDPEEIGDMGDAFVLMLSMLKKLSDPQMIDFMNRILELPMGINLKETKPLGPLGMLASWAAKRPGRAWGWQWNSPRPWAGSARDRDPWRRPNGGSLRFCEFMAPFG